MSNILDIRSQLKRHVQYIGHQKSTKQKSKFQSSLVDEEGNSALEMTACTSVNNRSIINGY